MIRSRLGLKALGLCAMLVGMMAFASVAQAEPNAFWRIAGAKLGANAPVEATTDVPGKLLAEIGGKPFHVTCDTVLLIGHLSPTLAQILGRLLFHGCKFFQLLTAGGVAHELKACQPLLLLDVPHFIHFGLVLTNPITGLIKLHTNSKGEKFGVVEAKPTTAGQPFATLALGEECAFGENIKVEGVFFLQDTNNKFSTELVEHLVSELPALTKLKVNGGAETAKVDGSAFAFLSGANKGKLFSGVPG